MAKKKMVLKVTMRCKKCQPKALQVDSETSGVESVALEGEDSLKNKVVVIGDGVEVACLTKNLRKKVGHAVIEIVDDIKERLVLEVTRGALFTCRSFMQEKVFYSLFSTAVESD